MIVQSKWLRIRVKPKPDPSKIKDQGFKDKDLWPGMKDFPGPLQPDTQAFGQPGGINPDIRSTTFYAP